MARPKQTLSEPPRMPVTIVNGRPVPLGPNGHTTAEELKNALDVQLARRLDPTDPLSPTKAEEIISQYVDDAIHFDPGIRIKARESLLDRVLGKATQRTESFNLKANLSDFLDEIADNEPENAHANAVDATFDEAGSDTFPFEI